MTVDDLGAASRVLAQCGISEVGLRGQVIRELKAAQERLTERDAEALAALGIDLDEVRRLGTTPEDPRDRTVAAITST